MFNRFRIWEYRVLPLGLTSVALLTGFYFMQELSGASTRVPFTAAVRETSYGRGGKVQTQDQITQVVRSDGSMARARTIQGPDNKTSAEQRVIIDLASAEEVVIDGFTESLTTSPLRQATVAWYRQSQPCTGDPEPDMLLGYQVVHDMVRISKSGEDRVIREERWHRRR